MFEDVDGGWDSLPPELIASLRPLSEDEPQPWELCDDDSWIDELAANDPERPRCVDDVLRDAEQAPIDAQLAAEIASIEASALNSDQQVALMAAAARLENHYSAIKTAAVAAFAGPEPRNDTSAAAFAWCEVGAALSIGERHARTYVAEARRLATHLPQTLHAHRNGALSWWKAATLVRASWTLTREQCAELEARVLDKAAQRTPAEHTRAVNRAVQRLDPDGADERRASKKRDIALIRFQHGDGIADMLLRHLESSDADTIWTAADTWARSRKNVGEDRSLDELRVIALKEWAVSYLTGASYDGKAPTRHGYPATVNVVIGLPELIAGAGTGMLATTGEPVPAQAVAELLRRGARIRFALTDQLGNLVGVSTKEHDPKALQRVYVTLRDLTARTPTGSQASVAGQDLDHIDTGGATEPRNLHAPTRGWHRAKTFGHWEVRPADDRTITWTSKRTGRTYVTHPFNYRDGP